MGGAGVGGVGSGGRGCSTDDPCPNFDWCVYEVGACAPDAKGICEPKIGCDGAPTGPACGCDGEVIEPDENDFGIGECTAWRKALPYTDPTVCASGTFPCGSLACQRNVEFCRVTLPGPMARPIYECIAVASEPGYCQNGIADCLCLLGSPMRCVGNSCCVADSDHQETVTLSAP